MEANPEKFQAIAVGKKSFDKSPIFQIGTANISWEEVAKLLGVDIDFMLNFDCHIKNICKKAVQQLYELKRMGKNLSKLNQFTIFHTFVISNFNVCPLSWHFCSETNTKKIEKIQERALRFVYQDYEASYENLLIKVLLTVCTTLFVENNLISEIDKPEALLRFVILPVMVAVDNSLVLI
jgi:hypothetical protein